MRIPPARDARGVRGETSVRDEKGVRVTGDGRNRRPVVNDRGRRTDPEARTRRIRTPERDPKPTLIVEGTTRSRTSGATAEEPSDRPERCLRSRPSGYRHCRVTGLDDADAPGDHRTHHEEREQDGDYLLSLHTSVSAIEGLNSCGVHQR